MTRKDFHNEDGSTSRVSMLKSTEDLYVEDRNVTSTKAPNIHSWPFSPGRKALKRFAQPRHN